MKEKKPKEKKDGKLVEEKKSKEVKDGKEHNPQNQPCNTRTRTDVVPCAWVVG